MGNANELKIQFLKACREGNLDDVKSLTSKVDATTIGVKQKKQTNITQTNKHNINKQTQL